MNRRVDMVSYITIVLPLPDLHLASHWIRVYAVHLVNISQHI